MATTYPYNKNIPLSTNKPSVDQPNMQTNTNSISSIISTDHLTFGTATGNQIDGMHTVVRLAVPQGSDPVAIGTIGQIYTKTLTIGETQINVYFLKVAEEELSNSLVSSALLPEIRQWLEILVIHLSLAE